MLFSRSLQSPTFDVLGFDVYPVPRPRPCPRPFSEPHPLRPEFCPRPANLAWVILDLARSQLKINVGRRGTNQLRLVTLTGLVPWRPCQTHQCKFRALVEGVLLRWFILSCEYLSSTTEIHAHKCYQLRRKNESLKLPDTRESLGNIEISLSNIKISLSNIEISFS